MCFVVHKKGKATGVVGAVDRGLVGSCKQLSVMFLEMEPCLQGWGQDIDLALRETETGQSIVTAEEHAIYIAETSPLGGYLLEFTLFSYLYVNGSVINKLSVMLNIHIFKLAMFTNNTVQNV